MAKGYRVARVEQTETPQDMKEKNKSAKVLLNCLIFLCLTLYMSLSLSVSLSFSLCLSLSIYLYIVSQKGAASKVVMREMCSVLSKGTRTYCHLDDLSNLEENAAGNYIMLSECCDEVMK